MKKVLATLLLSSAFLSCTACSQKASPEPTSSAQDSESSKTSLSVGYQLEKPALGEEIAVITTNQGEFKIRLFPQACPKAVENFKTLCSQGYYQGVIFHRVIKDFMIQGGDPTGTGTGGKSIWDKDFEDEFSETLFNITGAVSMANRGPNTNGSQFFINNQSPETFKWSNIEEIYKEYEKNPSYFNQVYGGSVDMTLITSEIRELYEKNGGNPNLDGFYSTSKKGHTVFGQVFEGMEVIDKISNCKTDSNDKPLEEIKIEKAEIRPYEEI